MTYWKPRTVYQLDEWLSRQYTDYKAWKYRTPQKWAMYYRVIRQQGVIL